VSSSPAPGKGVGEHPDEFAREQPERPAKDSQQSMETSFHGGPRALALVGGKSVPVT